MQCGGVQLEARCSCNRSGTVEREGGRRGGEEERGRGGRGRGRDSSRVTTREEEGRRRITTRRAQAVTLGNHLGRCRWQSQVQWQSRASNNRTFESKVPAGPVRSSLAPHNGRSTGLYQGLYTSSAPGASSGFIHRALTGLRLRLGARLLDLPKRDLQHGHPACPSKMKRGSCNGAGKKEARAISKTVHLPDGSITTIDFPLPDQSQQQLFSTQVL